MALDECLPPALRGPTTTITKIAAGLSGAGVYRVDAGGAAYVLKVSAPDPGWRGRIEILRRAADAGVAPAVIHVDEDRHAVVSAFVADRGFPARMMDPRTRAAAITQLGETLRRVHDLPLDDATPKDQRAFLAQIWAALDGWTLPAFVRDAAPAMLAEAPPPADRALVLGHNDVNPTNLVLDGERLLLLDWDTAAANEPLYDLAAIAVFLRLDDAACLALLAAHDGAPVAELPARFGYDRRLVAVLCGCAFLHLARQGGHPGGELDLADVMSLVDFYGRLRAGTLSPASPEGQWWFGLALVKAAQP